MQEQPGSPEAQLEAEPIPRGQRLFDSIFWLLVISLLISGVLYNAWGLLETFSIPVLPLQ